MSHGIGFGLGPGNNFQVSNFQLSNYEAERNREEEWTHVELTKEEDEEGCVALRWILKST